MSRLVMVLLWVLAAGGAVAQSSPQAPPPPSRGQLLYANHCQACHTVQLHWRDRKQATDWRSLKEQVRRWQAAGQLDWSEADIWHYVATHDVPYNELHDEFYPSIGCAPCTRAVSLGEDPRAGRWWWEGENTRECGLHALPNQRPEHRQEPVAA